MLVISNVETGCIITISSRRIKKHGNVSGKRHTAKSVGVLASFLLSTLVSWIPLQILMVFTMAGKDVEQDIVTWLSVTTFTANAITNPFLHTIRHLTLRKK